MSYTANKCCWNYGNEGQTHSEAFVRSFTTTVKSTVIEAFHFLHARYAQISEQRS